MSGQLVNTAYGQLKGEAGNGVNVWRGIPFAAPPLGELRFRAPQPPESWSGVREAIKFGPVSLQPVSTSGTRFGGTTPVYDEDCLYLNVWSPAVAEETGALPVMMWIHGGTFVTGAGSQPMFEGSKLAVSGNVVVVTVNYRLGPLGFLHLSPLGGGLGSNLGLLDQIAALEWVQQNIAAFGGDPARVTVFGESAGSMSIAALLAMPAAKGLFARAIMESGAAQTLNGEQGGQIAAALLAELGLQPGSDTQLLHKLPAGEIMEAAGRMAYKLSGDSMNMFFQPVVEPGTLPVEPVQAIAAGAASGIPVLIGTNLHEGNLFFREGQKADNFEQSLKALEQLMGVDDLSELTSDYSHTWEGQAEVLTDLFFGPARFRSRRSSRDMPRLDVPIRLDGARASAAGEGHSRSGDSICLQQSPAAEAVWPERDARHGGSGGGNADRLDSLRPWWRSGSAGTGLAAVHTADAGNHDI